MTISEFRLLKALEEVGGTEGHRVHADTLAEVTHSDPGVIDRRLRGMQDRRLVQSYLPLVVVVEGIQIPECNLRVWAITRYGQACINA